MDKKLVSKLDSIFSHYIRLRDVMPNGMCRCISCGHILPFSQMDCGHYMSRGNNATRWNEDNCNAECITCNRSDTNHLKGYKRNLIKKIGRAKVDELRVLAHSIKKYSDADLKEMIAHYKDGVKRLEKEKKVW